VKYLGGVQAVRIVTGGIGPIDVHSYVDVDVYIDIAKVVQQLAHRAVRNKSGDSSVLKGGLVVRAHNQRGKP
jgi:hypothetical protein